MIKYDKKFNFNLLFKQQYYEAHKICLIHTTPVVYLRIFHLKGGGGGSG